MSRTDQGGKPDQPGLDPRHPVGMKALWRVGAHAFLALVMLPTFILLGMAYNEINKHLQGIQVAAHSTGTVHLPGILDSQRSLINIENLRRYVETAYRAFDAQARREATLNAMALATDSVFDPDTRFGEYAGSARDLIRALAEQKNLSDEQENALHRAELQLASSLARVGSHANMGPLRDIRHAARHLDVRDENTSDSSNFKDSIAVLEPVLVLCTPQDSASPAVGKKPMPKDLREECDLLYSYIDDVERAWNGRIAAEREARHIWGELDTRLREMSDLTSSAEASLTYKAMEHIRDEAGRTQLAFYLSCAFITLVLLLFAFVLHRYVLLPLAQASRYLRRIHEGLPPEELSSVRIRELQEMLNILPVLRTYVEDLSARSGFLKQEKDKFENLSLLDGLTGVGNRRSFDLRLAGLEKGHCLALLMIDVDMFKLYNDTYGHQTGDSALIAVARAMRRALLRAGDGVYRYGGEEFCVLLPDAQEESALTVAARIQGQIRGLEIPHQGSPVANILTVSIGVALRATGEAISGEQMLERADKALYVAKNSGRNRIIVYEDKGEKGATNL